MFFTQPATVVKGVLSVPAPASRAAEDTRIFLWDLRTFRHDRIHHFKGLPIADKVHVRCWSVSAPTVVGTCSVFAEACRSREVPLWYESEGVGVRWGFRCVCNDWLDSGRFVLVLRFVVGNFTFALSLTFGLAHDEGI